ncbi:MAG: hypothetical protein OEQ18_10750 [Gammaproteobacteria bacterium]|nr:hypothetical protein [Gammaproteobacteria bacterium]
MVDEIGLAVLERFAVQRIDVSGDPAAQHFSARASVMLSRCDVAVYSFTATDVSRQVVAMPLQVFHFTQCRCGIFHIAQQQSAPLRSTSGWVSQAVFSPQRSHVN